MSYVKQVGGSHYSETQYQHWDMVIDTDMHYLLGCATKYLYRNKSNRYEDLEKAKSFVLKANNCGVKGVHQHDIYALYDWLDESLPSADIYAAIEFVAFGDYACALAAIDELIEQEAMDEMKAYVDQG